MIKILLMFQKKINNDVISVIKTREKEKMKHE